MGLANEVQPEALIYAETHFPGTGRSWIASRDHRADVVMAGAEDFVYG